MMGGTCLLPVEREQPLYMRYAGEAKLGLSNKTKFQMLLREERNN